MSRAEIGDGTVVDPGATVGVDYTGGSSPPVVGPDGVIRAGTIIYDDVVAGAAFQTGHYALIREETVIGDGVLVGTNTVIDGGCEVGDSVRMQTGAYVPRRTTIGDRVFLGPHATLLNDPYPLRREVDLAGPVLEDDATIGGNATILPGVTIGRRAFVAAGAVVTADVPRDTLAVGVPAECRDLPPSLEGGNDP